VSWTSEDDEGIPHQLVATNILSTDFLEINEEQEDKVDKWHTPRMNY